MIPMFISSKLTLPLITVLIIAIGCFGIYQYGKQTESKANFIQQQENYVNIRTKIDDAIKENPTISANDALSRLRQRQNK